MALNHSFFNKRETLAPMALRNASTSTQPAVTPQAATAPTTPAATAEPVAAPAVSQNACAPATTTGGSQLTVGPNIKLKGVEITDCDTLVVEGTVEATMDSRVIHIAQSGAFHGAAEIDIAEIHGAFTGTLTVRDKLFIHSTGKVSGTIRYGKVVIEEGGQLFGDIAVATAASKTAVRAAKTATQETANH